MVQVNRSLADPMMDDIDHALGRPKNPIAPTYRNYYAIDPETDQAGAMEASPYWMRVSYAHGGHLTCFVVTHEGCKALAQYLRDNA